MGTGPALAHATEGGEELRNPLRLVQIAEAAVERLAVECGRLDRRHRPGRVGDAPDRPLVAGRTGPILDMVRVDDQSGRQPKDLAGERELLRARLPEGRDAGVEEAVGEQAAG